MPADGLAGQKEKPGEVLNKQSESLQKNKENIKQNNLTEVYKRIHNENK